MSVTVVVAVEGVAMTNGSPVAAPIVQLKDVLHHDVALLLEIEPPRVGTTVHVVGQSNQVFLFNDERIALDSTTFFEKILIFFPLHIEIQGCAANLHRFTDFHPCAFTVSLGIPLRQIFVLLNESQFLKRRHVELECLIIDSRHIAGSERVRLVNASAEFVHHVEADFVEIVGRATHTCTAAADTIAAKTPRVFSTFPSFIIKRSTATVITDFWLLSISYITVATCSSSLAIGIITSRTSDRPCPV